MKTLLSSFPADDSSSGWRCCGKTALSKRTARLRANTHRAMEIEKKLNCFGRFNKYPCSRNAGVWHVGHRGKWNHEAAFRSKNGWFYPLLALRGEVKK